MWYATDHNFIWVGHGLPGLGLKLPLEGREGRRKETSGAHSSHKLVFINTEPTLKMSLRP
jgi:hypothetical protein